ncbi:coiled-coil domain-containing protein 138 [Lagopus muta]|uniref:coiled-coil domain-containing protein 138 n=1 Tax=Lagopus muta TaxID=64668 RepID=UPI00209CD8E4|nr:coiled-coil domain-containing protein 138 [Lagopus muta]
MFLVLVTESGFCNLKASQVRLNWEVKALLPQPTPGEKNTGQHLQVPSASAWDTGSSAEDTQTAVKIQNMKKDSEVNKLEMTLREMTKCRDDLKEANESLRKQWKHQFIMAEMYKDTCEVAQQMTPFMQEEVRAASKGDKLLPNSEVYGLLTVLMDWILDELLSKLKKREEREDGQKPQCSGRTYIQESV